MNHDEATELTNSFNAAELYTGWMKIQKLPTFLSSLLIGSVPDEHHSEERFRVDIGKKHASVPTYCTPQSSSTIVTFEGYEEIERGTTYVNERIDVTLKDIDKRPPGVDMYTWARVPIRDRFVLLTQERNRRMRERLDNLFEVQLAQQLQTGIIPIKGKEVDMEFDIRMPTSNKIVLAGDNRWSQESSKLGRMASVEKACMAMRDNSFGVIPSTMVMDPLSYAALLKDPEMRERNNLRHTPLGTFAPALLADQYNTVTYAGQILFDSGITLTMYVYSGKYPDPVTKLPTPYINDWSYVLLDSDTPVRRHYGRINNINAALAGQAQSDMYTFLDLDPKGKYWSQIYETAPVAIAEDAEGIVAVKTA